MLLLVLVLLLLVVLLLPVLVLLLLVLRNADVGDVDEPTMPSADDSPCNPASFCSS